LPKETNQQRSGEEKAAYLLVCQRQTALCCSQNTDASGSREVYTPLRGTPPSRLSVFCCAARLRDMAIIKKSYLIFVNYEAK
jgi:hypothetical protein